MTKNLDKEGLRSVFDNYELLFIDLWGVVHNGIELHENAIHTLSKISEAKKDYILLTNAPRPNKTAKNFLEKFENVLLFLTVVCLLVIIFDVFILSKCIFK